MIVVSVIFLLVVYAAGLSVHATMDWLADLAKRRKAAAADKPAKEASPQAGRVEPVLLSEENNSRPALLDPIVEEEPVPPFDEASACDLSYADLYAE